MQCPHCQKNVTLFLVKQAPTGKEQLCSHCGGGLKVTFSVPALLGCFVAAVVVTLLLYPMLGRIATALAGSGHARSPACPGCDDPGAGASTSGALRRAWRLPWPACAS